MAVGLLEEAEESGGPRSRAVPLALSAEELLEKCPAPHCISPGLACQEHFRRSRRRRALSAGSRPVPLSGIGPSVLPRCPRPPGRAPRARTGSLPHQPPAAVLPRGPAAAATRPALPAGLRGVRGVRGPWRAAGEARALLWSVRGRAVPSTTYIRVTEVSRALLRPAGPPSLERDPPGQGTRVRQGQDGFGPKC